MAKVQVKRVGVFSLAKIYAITMAAAGVIIGVIYGLIFMAVGGAIMAGGRDSGASAAGASSLVIGLIMMVAIPIFYGVLGFIAGLVGGAIYNVAARTVGGIELELENMDGSGYAPPPSPNWNAQSYQPGQQQQYPY